MFPDAAFPLTPALSLREREERLPCLRQSNARQLLAEWNAEFPLPEGEGQGEGERHVQTAFHSQFDWRLAALSLVHGFCFLNSCFWGVKIPGALAGDITFLILISSRPPLRRR